MTSCSEAIAAEATTAGEMFHIYFAAVYDTSVLQLNLKFLM